MRLSPPDWVPPGAWLAPGYAEWAPPPALSGAVACLWASLRPEVQEGQGDQDGQEDQPGLVLPDACTDLIWERGVGAYVAGPDTGPFRPASRPGTVIVGVRFRPSAGGQVLKTPLSEIMNQRVPLTELLRPAQLPSASKPLSATLDPAEAAGRVLATVGALVTEAAPDPAIAQAAALLRNPAARTEAVAAEVGLSERQFRRRCQAAVGYGPKTLQRVLRFQRFVRLLDAAPAPPDLAAVAARAGYADQAHLTRECSGLSGLTPARLARIRRPWPAEPAEPAE
jgi:AraC-like DNA-binding protein